MLLELTYLCIAIFSISPDDAFRDISISFPEQWVGCRTHVVSASKLTMQSISMLTLGVWTTPSSEFTSQHCSSSSCTAELTSPVSPVLLRGISVSSQTTLLFLDELPSTVKALNDGWLATYQISTVVVRALSRGTTP